MTELSITPAKELVKLTPAQRRVLSILLDPTTDTGLVIYGIRSNMLARLQLAGFVKYRPYGKPPTWVTTHMGKQALERRG